MFLSREYSRSIPTAPGRDRVSFWHVQLVQVNPVRYSHYPVLIHVQPIEMDFSYDELAIIALLLDVDKKKYNRAPRNYWVHSGVIITILQSSARKPKNNQKMSLIFNKKYKLDRSENFDEYMKALGVGMVKRTLANTIYPVVELTKNDDGKFVLSSNSTMKNFSIVFNLDEEFDEETLDGRQVKAIIRQDGNKLVHVQKHSKHSDTTIVREFEPDQLKMFSKIK
ncbi:hypothetical protein AGLY_007481 [Aphis glycines]|uniref:Cytosolic fatty-acid binding proteins domain-containing protein n=1 Tax=Aphis glycines TaxID=307491 RepID=A0A6G0TPE4_APHGL|nr:hypothetical protein AGLY_007481 [Aphis glycines]